jgi:hypothetical protein
MPGETGLGSSERADLNVLELELRKLPAVVAVGFEGPSAGAPMAEDAILTVQLLVNDHDAGPTVEQQALDLARLHLGRPLQVVITPESPETAWVTAQAEPPTRNRVRIVDVNLVDNGRAVEVTLDQAQRQAVARGGSSSPVAAAGATLGALRQLGWLVPFDVASAVRLSVGSMGAVLVHLVAPEGDRLGASSAETAERAAVKATLQALNRWLDEPSRLNAAPQPTATRSA